MAQISGKAAISIAINFTISEEEARALDAMVGYGDDAFVKTFYEGLGKAYMERHEAGLRLFLKSIRNQLPGVLQQADNCRKAFPGQVV